MESGDRANAYLTVEATMVLPTVIGVLIFLLYMMFFQYNRCLMEQDMGALAIRSVTMQEKDKPVLAGRLREEAATLAQEKYLVWSMSDISLLLEGNGITLYRSGKLTLPSGEFWTTQAKGKSEQIDPVFLIRNCKKLMGGK